MALFCGAALQAGASVLDLFPEQLEDAEGNPVSREVLDGKVVGVYFSAEWCPPCRAFTPALVDFRNANKDKFELVFVSSDRTAEAQRKYMSGYKMDFPTVPHGADEVAALRTKFGVRGIPHLGILDSDGNILAQNGRMTVANNPEGALAEWTAATPAPAEEEDTPSPAGSNVLAEFNGTLSATSGSLETGEFIQSHKFSAEGDASLRVDLMSDDFDAVLVVVGPNGERWENDDFGDSSNSRVTFDVSAGGGEYTIYATTFEEGEAGAYKVVVSRAQSPNLKGREIASTLDETATVRIKHGGFMRAHTFDGKAGTEVTIDMTSSDFDTFLILVAPNGTDRWINDDYEEDDTRSRLTLSLPETGEYTIIAASYEPGETGHYRIVIAGLE